MEWLSVIEISNGVQVRSDARQGLFLLLTLHTQSLRILGGQGGLFMFVTWFVCEAFGLFFCYSRY